MILSARVRDICDVYCRLRVRLDAVPVIPAIFLAALQRHYRLGTAEVKLRIVVSFRNSGKGAFTDKRRFVSQRTTQYSEGHVATRC